MNRAYRRIEAKTKEATFTESQVKKMIIAEGIRQYDRARENVRKTITDNLLSTIAVSLKYKFGFGKKRMSRLIKEVNLQLQLVTDKVIDTADLIEIANKMGVDF